jgi:hypothetical protein
VCESVLVAQEGKKGRGFEHREESEKGMGGALVD